MRINIVKCDKCGNDMPAPERPVSMFSWWTGPSGPELNISLKAGGNGMNSFFRDFCGEECLRDYLVLHLAKQPNADTQP